MPPGRHSRGRNPGRSRHFAARLRDAPTAPHSSVSGQPARCTAVLVFAKSARADLCARFGGLPAHVRQRLGSGLERQLREEVRASGLPAVFSTEREQRGGTYGERLTNACADALALGFERLIVVGGDCPGLRARHLRAAATELSAGRAVVGRDLRGGVYLFGFDAACVGVASLRGLPYCSAVLAKTLTGVLSGGSATVTELERLGDIHEVTDLRREWRRFCAVGLRRMLRGALGAFAKTRPDAAVAAPISRADRRPWALRGPPALAA